LSKKKKQDMEVDAVPPAPETRKRKEPEKDEAVPSPSKAEKRKKPSGEAPQQKAVRRSNIYFGDTDIGNTMVHKTMYENKPQYEVTKKDRKALWCETPPMLLVYPRLHNTGTYPSEYSKDLESARFTAQLRDTTDGWPEGAVEALAKSGMDVGEEHRNFVSKNRELVEKIAGDFFEDLPKTKIKEMVNNRIQSMKAVGVTISREKALELVRGEFIASFASPVADEKIKIENATEEEIQAHEELLRKEREARGNEGEGAEEEEEEDDEEDETDKKIRTGRNLFKFGKNAFRKLNDDERKKLKKLTPEEIEDLSEIEQLAYRSNKPLKYSPLKIVGNSRGAEKQLNLDNIPVTAWHGDIATLTYTLKPYYVPGGDKQADRFGVRVNPIKLRLIKKGERKAAEGGTDFGELEDEF